MKRLLTFLVVGAALIFTVASMTPTGGTSAATPTPADSGAIVKEILGQGASAVAPDRILLLQRRTFAPGADSGAHPAAGPTVLYVEFGTVEFAVADGAATTTRAGGTGEEIIASGDRVTLQQGDSVFYDAGVVHAVSNPGTAPAVTLEARLNPPA